MLRGEYTVQVRNPVETIAVDGIQLDEQKVTGSQEGESFTFTYLAALPASELHLYLPIMRGRAEP
jgi:hypothetical protein